MQTFTTILGHTLPITQCISSIQSPAGRLGHRLDAPLLLTLVLIQHKQDGGIGADAQLLLESIQVLLPGDAALLRM